MAVSQRFAGTFATRAALQALGSKNRVDGQIAIVASDFSTWMYVAASALVTTADPNGELALTPSDAPSTGRWLRADKHFVMKLAIGFATADAALLLTVLEGFALRMVEYPFWEVTADFTGGASSAIGVSTNKASYNTKGDLLGGATGDVAAGLTAGVKVGTMGVKLDTPAERQALILVEGDAIRFDRITSVFAAGAGFVRLPVVLATAPATP
jgi:hypothetical protein